MADNKTLLVDIDLLINPDKIGIKPDVLQTRLRNELQKVLSSALSKVSLKGGALNISKDLFDPRAMAEVTKAMQREGKKYVDALNYIRGGGEELKGAALGHAKRISASIGETELLRLSEANKLLTTLHRKQVAYARAVKLSSEAYQKSIAGGALSTAEINALQARRGTGEQLRRATTAVQTLGAEKTIRLASGELAYQKGLDVPKVSAAAKAVSDELSHLNRVLNTTASAVKAAAASEKLRQQELARSEQLSRERAIVAARKGRIFGETPTTLQGVRGVLSDISAQRRLVLDQRDEFIGRRAATGRAVDPRTLAGFDKQLSDLAGKENQLKPLSKAFNQLSGEAHGLNQKLSQSSLLIRQFFRYAIGYGALYKVIGAISSLTSGVVELDRALFSIKAITAATDEQMSKISGSIKEVAVTTKFTTLEVAKAAQVLAQAGVEPNQINKVLSSVAYFAAGTETALTTAADVVSTMRNVFKELDELTIANQLTKAINISKLTGDDLKTILGISAQVAQQFNITSEQYLAAVATLRNAGLKASTVATGLRQGLLEIFSPDSKTIKDLAQRYSEIGEAISLDEIRSKFFAFTQEANPLLSVLRELNRLGFVGAGRKTLARSLDIRASNAITALIKNLDELEQSQIKLSGGNAALEASRTQMDSLANSVDNLGAAMTVLASDISEGPLRALEDLVDYATDAVKALDELHMKSLAAGGAGLASAAKLAAAGGLTGALIKGTPATKAVAAVTGAALGAGAGAGIATLEDPKLADKAVNAALFAATVIPIFKGLGRAAEAGKKALSGTTIVEAAAAEAAAAEAAAGVATVVETSVAASAAVAASTKATVTLTSSIKSKVTSILAGIAGFGARFLPFIGWVGLALELAYEFTDLFKGKDAELKELNRQIQSAQRRSIQLSQRTEGFKAELETYRPTDLSQGFTAAPGKTAGAIEGIRELLTNTEFTFERLFGNLVQDKKEQLDKLFQQLGTVGAEEGPAREALLKEVSDLVGKDVKTFSKQEKESFLSLVAGRNQLFNSLIGGTQDLAQELKNLQDILLREGELEGVSKASYESLRGIIASNINFIEVLNGNMAALSKEQLVSLLEEYTKSTYEKGKVFLGLEQAVKTQTEQLADKMETEFKKLETAGISADDIQATISRLLADMALAGDKADEYLDLLATRLERFIAQAEANKVEIPRLRELAEKEPQGSYAQSQLQEKAALLESELPNLQGLAEISKPALAAIQASKASRKEAIEKLNTELLFTINTAVEEVAKNKDAIASAMAKELSTDKSFAELFKKLTEATAEQVQEIVSGEITTVKGKKLASGALTELVKFIKDYDARRKFETTERKKELKGKTSDTYIADPAAAKRIFSYEQQIEKAQKENVRLLADASNALNPIILKRNELLKEAEAELQVQKGNVALAKEKLDFATSEKEDPEELAKLAKSLRSEEVKLAEQEIKLLKIRSDADKDIYASKVKVETDLLAARQRHLDAEEKAVKTSIDSAIAAGDIKALVEAQAKRRELIKQQLLLERDTEVSKRTENSVIEDIIKAKERQLKADEAIAAISEQIAISQERLRFSQGKFTTQSEFRDAFESAVGKPRTREAKAENLAPQIKKTVEEMKRLAAAQQAMEKAGTATEESTRKYNDELRELQTRLGELTGEYYNLTKAVEAANQMSETFNVESLRSKFQALKSDVSNLADSIQDRFVSAIDSIGDAIADALIEGKNFKESMRQIFYSMFKDMAAAYAKTFVNTAIQKILGGIKGEIEGQPNAEKSSIFDVLFGGSDKKTSEVAKSTTAELKKTAEQDLGSAGFLGKFFESFKTGFSALFTGLKSGVGDILSGIAGLFTKGGGGGAVASSAAGGGGGGWAQWIPLVLSFFGAKDGISGLKVKGYANGGTPGIIKGPGTGTSDSVPGFVVGADGRRLAPIAVSDGESILTAKATKLLGEKFIADLNAGKGVMKFAAGNTFSGFNTKDRAKSPLDTMASAMANQKPVTEVNASTRIVNVVDPKLVTDGMASATGEKVILNVIRRAGFEPAK